LIHPQDFLQDVHLSKPPGQGQGQGLDMAKPWSRN
jgi:hypothetical protein